MSARTLSTAVVVLVFAAAPGCAVGSADARDETTVTAQSEEPLMMITICLPNPKLRYCCGGEKCCEKGGEWINGSCCQVDPHGGMICSTKPEDLPLTSFPTYTFVQPAATTFAQ